MFPSNQSLFGATVVLSGAMTIKLGSLSSYGSSYSGSGPISDSGLAYDDLRSVPSLTAAPTGYGTGTIYFNPYAQPIPPLQPLNPKPVMGILTQYKNGVFYNQEAFFDFIEQCRNKVLIFIDGIEEKIVDKREALKFVLQFFLSAKKYKNWDDFEYRDDEWHLFFREAKNAPEILESFDFTREQIKEILCI